MVILMGGRRLKCVHGLVSRLQVKAVHGVCDWFLGM